MVSPDSSSILYPLQVDVHHSQSQTVQLPHLWNTLIIQAFRELLLQNLPDVFILS